MTRRSNDPPLSVPVLEMPPPPPPDGTPEADALNRIADALERIATALEPTISKIVVDVQHYALKSGAVACNVRGDGPIFSTDHLDSVTCQQCLYVMKG